MKATGIVRRIDDLGRIVIPKEIRRTLRIREGNSLEIYTDSQGSVIFRKYSPIGEMDEIADTYTQVLHKISGRPVFICDCERVTAVSGLPKKEYLDKKISKDMENLIYERETFDFGESGKTVLAFEHLSQKADIVIPIIASSEAVGAVFSLHDDNERENVSLKKLMQASALLLEKQLGF